MSIRTVLVDDHDLIRQGLRTAFDHEPDIEVVAEAATVRTATAALATHEYDVVVTDLGLPDGNGLDVVRHARRHAPTVGIVVLTMYDGEEHLFDCLDAGASAYITKGSPTSEVVTAIRHTAMAPTSFMARDLATAMRHRMAQHEQAGSLTAREREVLDRLCSGLSIADIARQLYMSTSTVKTHIAKVYEKLGVHSRTEAVLAAVRLGVVSPQ